MLIVSDLGCQKDTCINLYPANKSSINCWKHLPFMYDSGGSSKGSRWNPSMHKL